MLIFQILNDNLELFQNLVYPGFSMRSHLKSIIQYIRYISGRQTATRNQEGLTASIVYALCYKKVTRSSKQTS